MEPNPNQKVPKKSPSSSDTQKTKVSNQDKQNSEDPGPSPKKAKTEAFVQHTVSDPRIYEHGEVHEVAVSVTDVELDEKSQLIVKTDDIIPHNETTYKVVHKLGAGGFGAVYKVVDMNTLRNKAVKIMKLGYSQNEIEAMQKLKTLDSPMINQMIDNFLFKDHECLLFDLLGESLYDYIYIRRKMSVPFFQIKDIGVQIVSALQFLHSNQVVHADIKPANIVFAKPEEMPDVDFTYIRQDTHIKLIDYSLSCFTAEPCFTHAQTLRYMAPETALFLGFSFPSDVWSLGAVLWELLNGYQLFWFPETDKNREDPRSPQTKKLELLMMMQLLLGPIPAEMFEQRDGENSNVKYLKTWIDVNEAAMKIQHPDYNPVDYLVSNRPNVRQFLDLVKACLVFDPNMRITMDAALLHPFFADD